MDVNSPETWRWIWLVAVVGFALAEVFTPVLFFMGSFAIGAAAAAVAAFAGGGPVIQWALFVGVSAVSLAALTRSWRCRSCSSSSSTRRRALPRLHLPQAHRLARVG